MPVIPPTLKRRPWNLVAVAAALVVLAAVVAPFVYINLIREDAADRLTLEDALSSTTTTEATGDGDTSTTVAGAAAESGIDGSWAVTDGSQAQYRAKEVLFGQDAEATGSTEDVTGSLEAAGTTISAVTVEVDMTTITSDQSRRDGQFHGRIMDTATHPTATFVLTEPIELSALPADGEPITAEATGELTLRGVTQTVTVSVDAALSNGTIVVNTTIPIDFDDYAIPDASGGPATVGRSGEIELLAVFVRG